MIKVKVITGCNRCDFEMDLNTKLIELQKGHYKIVDIKYDVSAYGGYTALIMYEGVGNGN